MVERHTLLLLALLCAGCDRPLAETLGLVERRALYVPGPAPAGTEVEYTLSLAMRDGELKTADGGYARMSVEGRIQERFVWRTADELELTRTEDLQRTTITIAGEDETEEERGSLEGLKLLGRRGGDRFSWQLAEGLPTEAQREDMEDLSPGVHYLSEEPVGPGDVWSRSAEALLGEMGGSIASEGPGLRGSGVVRFLGVRELAEEPCVEVGFAAEGIEMTMEEGQPPLRMDLEGESCVGLRSGEERSYHAEGWFSMQDESAQMLGTLEMTGGATVQF